MIILDVVRAEAVTAGVAGGYADATAVQAALAGRSVTEAPDAATVDAVSCSRRRTSACSSRTIWRWAGGISRVEGVAAVTAVRDACRITAELAEDYLEELR